MSNRPLRLILLLAVVLLAAALALTTARGAGAGSLFQSSPLLPGDAAFPTETPQGSPFDQLPVTQSPDLLLTVTPELAPILDPGLLPTETPEPAPGGPGFLPAPTLTNPDELLAGGSLSAAAPSPLSGEAAPVEEPEPTPDPGPPGAAQLIDSAVVAFGYVWLCCGAVLLAAAAVVFVWLMRRSARRRSRI